LIDLQIQVLNEKQVARVEVETEIMDEQMLDDNDEIIDDEIEIEKIIEVQIKMELPIIL
jgi:PP-loop superfamily ATP-utilizing enzyme